ncbi:MAG: Ig-like domain-containing protein [Gemmatimonadales bacterium]
MPITERRLAFVLAIGLATGVYGCGGDGLVLPGGAAKITVMSGDQQSGTAGSRLGQPVVALVADEDDRPVEGQGVVFEIETGQGKVTPDTVLTDTEGHASASWTLGTPAGAQKLRARVFGNGSSSTLTVEFSATALAGTGSTLSLLSGDAQTGPVRSALADSLVVKVSDALGNPVSGIEVLWTAAGGGSISPASVTTGPDGLAAAERVLGSASGAQSSEATASGLAGSPVTFTHTAVAANPASLLYVSGDGQTAPAGFQLADTLLVRLVDDNGNGIGGKAITWVVATGGGSVVPVNTTTNPNGYASTRWTLGPSAGSNLLNAVFSGVPSVPFTATGTADAPTTLARNLGDNQSGAVGSTLPVPLSVKVTDGNGNPVANVTVTWTANDGGSVSAPTSSTNSSGIAQVNRTLGLTPGSYGTTAAVDGLNGSPVTFTSTATVGAPAALAFDVQPTSAGVGQTITPAVQVSVRDAQGLVVTTSTKLISLFSSVNGSLDGVVSLHAIAGIATFPGISIDRAGSGFTLTAHASGLDDAISDPFDIGQAATSTAVVSSDLSTNPGDNVTFTATVTATPPAAGTPGGQVGFFDGATQIGTSNLNGSGVATLSTTGLASGSHSITAAYLGSTDFAGSTSSAITQVVAAAPLAADDAYPVNEDASLSVDAGSGVLHNDTPSSGVTAELVAGPSNQSSFTLNPDGSFDYTPVADFNGTDSFTYRTNDGSLTSNTATVTITVNPVNDAPAFTKGADQSAGPLSGPQSIPGWATALSPGPSNESGQILSFETSTDGDGAFFTLPAVSSAGTLTYTPSPFQLITVAVTVTVRVHDDGGTSNGGVDASDPQTFTITIGP